MLRLAVAVGHMKMTEDKLVSKIHLLLSSLVSLLKKSWKNACAVYIQSATGEAPASLTDWAAINGLKSPGCSARLLPDGCLVL